MTKKEIIDRVVELIQDQSGTMRNLVGAWVNTVLDDIAAKGLLESLEREETANLVQGQRNYALPDDTDKVRLVEVPAWGEPQGRLVKVDDEEFRKLMRTDGLTLQGRPQWYTIFAGRTLRLHPVANADNAPASPTEAQKLHIVKYKDIKHLAEADDITELRPKHTPTILWGAYAFGARFDTLGDVTNAEQHYLRGLVDLGFNQAIDLDRPRASTYQDI